jgi:hypothetical protein
MAEKEIQIDRLGIYGDRAIQQQLAEENWELAATAMDNGTYYSTPTRVENK